MSDEAITSRRPWYRRPKRKYVEKDFIGSRVAYDATDYPHRDVYGRVTVTKENVLHCISPIESHTRPLLVQATPKVIICHPASVWRRVKAAGKVPTVL
ncbi:MAG: hypothetical protein LQ341_003478 [Variospora aurantia]|nr:MAG: hypothetical protein LQ341_003478 [Variospora aurantia]